MKKVVFMLLSLGAFLVNANATCYIKPQYPGSGSAPKAYCWDIRGIYSENYPHWEDTRYTDSAKQNHGGNYIFTSINAYGYSDHTTADISFNNMTLYSTTNIYNSYNILIGKNYLYYIYPNTLNSGLIRAKQYSVVKDSVYFH